MAGAVVAQVGMRWGYRGVGGRRRAGGQPGGQTLSSPSPWTSWPCTPAAGVSQSSPTPLFPDLPHPCPTPTFTHLPGASGESVGHMGRVPKDREHDVLSLAHSSNMVTSME